MGKQVPLVIYEKGIRTVIGMASIQDDGSVKMQINKASWPWLRDRFLPGVGEFSINPSPSPIQP